MATRSTIALEFVDDTVGQVYCHWDGYLSHNGTILLENYSDPFKLRDLIDLGDLSVLAAEIGTKHDFDARVEGVCTFYGRDRSEHNVYARYFKDFADYRANGQAEEYDYLLRNIDGVATWFVSDHNGDFMLLTEALAKEAQAELEVA
jgi:hypothetical protein